MKLPYASRSAGVTSVGRAPEDVGRLRPAGRVKLEGPLVGHDRLERHPAPLPPAGKERFDGRQVVVEPAGGEIRVAGEGGIAVVVGAVRVVDAHEHVGAQGGGEQLRVAVIAGVGPVGVLDGAPVAGLLPQEGRAGIRLVVPVLDQPGDGLPVRRGELIAEAVDALQAFFQPDEKAVVADLLQKAGVLRGILAGREVEHVQVGVIQQAIQVQVLLEGVGQQVFVARDHRQRLD